MTLKLIFNITLTLIIIYIFFIYNLENLIENVENVENVENFTDEQKIDIKKIINELYMSDVDAIRNLSDVATKLQTSGKLILPGDLDVQGNLTVNGKIPGYLRFYDLNDILKKKNTVRFIRVGNMKSTDIFTEGEIRAMLSSMNFNNTTNSTANTTATNSTATDISFAVDDWTLIEIRVFDDTGTNIALNKDVKFVTLKDYDFYKQPWSLTKPLYPLNNIINGKISENESDDETVIKNDMIINGFQGKGKGPHQLEIDLKGEYNISQIQLFNIRVPSKTIRMNNTIVELISDNGPRKYITNQNDLNYSNDRKIPQELIIKT